MSRVYKIIIYDQQAQEKRRVRIRVNMPLDDIQDEIRRLFQSRQESARVAERHASA
jgi:hypothetical protein